MSVVGDLERLVEESKGIRWTTEEALEVLVECALIKDLVEVLEEKAAADLKYHQDKPKLKLV